jgi:hypothetical protein
MGVLEEGGSKAAVGSREGAVHQLAELVSLHVAHSLQPHDRSR